MNSTPTASTRSESLRTTIALSILGTVLVLFIALHYLTLIDLAIPFHRAIVTMLLTGASLEPFIYLYQPKSIYLLGVSCVLLFGFWYFIASLIFIGEF